jgi:glutamyl-Q tRNA(Asp) synthetase
VLVTRFAPSPTGYLHLGHVVNAIYVWGVAAARGGRVLLRIEDHDRIRSRPEYEAAILEDLRWLGFVGDTTPHRQSDHPAAYEEALARLRKSHRVYACDCSRREIGGERYPGRCRTRHLADSPGCGLRVEIGPGVERFIDERLGLQEQDPSGQCGDLLLRDRDGHWTYQFAVTVDDHRQGVTHVIRGEDILSSTGRQIRLGRMLGRSAPAIFLHHPLLINPSGDKLSKSSGDTGVRELRESGVAAEEVIGRAAHAAGLLERPRPVAADEVATFFG